MIELLRKHMVGIVAIFFIIMYLFINNINLKKSDDTLVINEGLVRIEELYEVVEIDQTPSNKLDVKVPVYICGQVNNDGVYYVDESSIIQDVIECAGGVTDQADLERVNLASKVNPHERIYIPEKGEALSGEMELQTDFGQVSDGLVNINLASQNELQQLPGIGEVKAAQIVAYRQENGKFVTLEELMNVSGIGEKSYQVLKDRIKLE